MLSDAPTSDVTAFRMTAPGPALGTIAMVTRDSIKAATMTSWFLTDYRWIPQGFHIERCIITGNLLTLQRNEAVQRMQGSWLLFIDDDMVWETDAVERLVAARNEIDADIIGGLCFRRSAPHEPTMYMRENATSGGYIFLEDWSDDIVEVDATGMAFCLIHKRVFELIGGPRPTLTGPPNFFRWEGTLGEDLRFCQDAKAAGARIFVDTRLKIGHISEVEIGQREYLLEMAHRSPETEAARARTNAALGLPTLTANQARERLG